MREKGHPRRLVGDVEVSSKHLEASSFHASICSESLLGVCGYVSRFCSYFSRAFYADGLENIGSPASRTRGPFEVRGASRRHCSRLEHSRGRMVFFLFDAHFLCPLPEFLSTSALPPSCRTACLNILWMTNLACWVQVRGKDGRKLEDLTFRGKLLGPLPFERNPAAGVILYVKWFEWLVTGRFPFPRLRCARFPWCRLFFFFALGENSGVRTSFLV